MPSSDIFSNKNEIEIIAEKVKSSLESTMSGLELFANSLERSGLRASTPAYRQMQQVLVQQRLWSDGQKRIELEPLWDQIGKQSETIYNTLKPIVQIMDELRTIDKIKYEQDVSSQNSSHREEMDSQSLPPSRGLSYLQQQIINLLMTFSPYVSAIKLSNLTSAEKSLLIKEANILVEKGILNKKGKGQSISYQLARASRENFSIT